MDKVLNQLLIDSIKEKPQIKDLENDFIESRLNQYFLTNGDLRKKLEREFENRKNKIIKSKNFKKALKDTREEIGQLYGQFLTNKFKKKEKILGENNINENLMIHKSTRERIIYYNNIYEEIFSWYTPKYIADLCCGMNPLSYTLMKIKPEYFATDLNPKDMEFLNTYFKENNIAGVAISNDVSKLNFLNDRNFQKADLVFLFKALDSLETIKTNISKKLLEEIPQKKIVISFPTKSLIAKKQIKSNTRNWFTGFLEKKGWPYQQFEVENEVFFLISK